MEDTIKTIKFTCPNCGGNELGQLQNVLTTYKVTKICNDGNLEYNHFDPEIGDGITLSHQCMDCGYELRDKSGNVVEDCAEVYEAVKNLNNPDS